MGVKWGSVFSYTSCGLITPFLAQGWDHKTWNHVLDFCPREESSATRIYYSPQSSMAAWVQALSYSLSGKTLARSKASRRGLLRSVRTQSSSPSTGARYSSVIKNVWPLDILRYYGKKVKGGITAVLELQLLNSNWKTVCPFLTWNELNSHHNYWKLGYIKSSKNFSDSCL